MIDVFQPLWLQSLIINIFKFKFKFRTDTIKSLVFKIYTMHV